MKQQNDCTLPIIKQYLLTLIKAAGNVPGSGPQASYMACLLLLPHTPSDTVLYSPFS